MKKQRKRYAPEEKVAILRRHLLENEPISKLYDELGLAAHAVWFRTIRGTRSWISSGAGRLQDWEKQSIIGFQLMNPLMI